MRRSLRFILPLLLVAASFTASPQYYDAGHEPAGLKWKVISTSSFDLIFADTFIHAAQQLAIYLDSVIPVMQKGFGNPIPKIPIVLHNNMSLSNAFVGWAPSRMEFYTMPPGDLDSHDWLEQLAIHESVHWFQFSQMYQGMTGFFGKVFGEHIPAAVMGLYIPFWLIEGDAVYHETAFSASGRGRDASFEQLLRTRFVTAKPHNYNKAVLGSYRTRSADHYELGYQLVSYGRERYGNKIWDSVYRYVARNPWNPMAFNTAMRRYTGKGKTRFYKEAASYLAEQWSVADTAIKHDTAAVILKMPFNWVEYHRPLVWMMGEYIAERKSLNDISAIVRIDGKGRERVICYPGYSNVTGLSRTDERLYYSAWSKHPRWPNIQYLDIWVYDFLRDTLSRLTQHGRFFSPVEDPVNGEIYAMCYRDDHRFNIVKMTPDGEILTELELPAGMSPSQAGWWAFDDCLVFAGVTAGGKAIYSWDGESPVIRRSEFTNANIGYPAGYNNGILFHAPFDGLNQIYLLIPETGATFQITNTRFGALYPSSDSNGDLLFSRVLTHGIAISSLPRDQWLMKRVTWPQTPSGFLFADKFKVSPFEGINVSELCDSCYPVKDYNRLRNLFRIHSWAPADIDPYNNSVKPGISIMSQNTLSTAFMRAGFRYDMFSPGREYYTTFTYKGFWPVIDLSYNFAEVFYSDPDIDFWYGRHDAGLVFTLPLSSVRGKWSRYFSIETGGYYTDIVHFKQTYSGMLKGDLFYLYNRLYAHKIRRIAVKDLYPRRGQAVDIVALNTVAGKLDAGNVTGVRITTYWPGILRNHGLRLYFAAQKRFTGEDLNFNRIVAIPKGYRNDEITVNDAVAIQAMYKLPLLYPDLDLGPLAYIKRISASGFIDVITDSLNAIKPSFYSYGFEVNADLHFLRHFAPFTIGYGYAFREDGRRRSYFMMDVEFTL